MNLYTLCGIIFSLGLRFRENNQLNIQRQKDVKLWILAVTLMMDS